MAGFNPNVPTILGSEYLPGSAALLRVESGQAAYACRFRSPGTPTISALHVPVESVTGNPGLALEIVSSLTPTIGYTDYFPGTDTGASVTGWQDEGASTANYTEIDDRADAADYHKNTSAVAANATLVNLHRGNDSGALSGKRVLRVDVGATIHVRRVNGNGTQVPVVARLVIDGTAYNGPARQKPQTNLPVTDDLIGSWDLNPSTGIPWTAAEVDDILDSTDADTFGITVKGRLAASGFRLVGKWLRVWTCAENRMGYYYQGGQPTLGWKEYTLSGTSALSADTSYYVVVGAPYGTSANWFGLRRISDPNATLDNTAAGTGEHRLAYDLRLFARGAAAVSGDYRVGMLPYLLDASTTIQSPSQPYQTVNTVTVKRSGGTTTPGQQFTTDGSTTSYGGVWATVAWEDPLRRPDQPLKVELRDGSGVGGAGTLRATGYLNPDDTTAGPNRVLIAFQAAYTTAAATQYNVTFSSEATYGWKLHQADTGSGTVSGTTAAEVEGATQGGQTDSYIAAGAASDRYDLDAALIASPTAPGSFTATVTAGTSEDRPNVLLAWSATSLTTSFGSYRIWRRASRAAARAWTLIGENDIPDGYTAATVEAQHTSFVDRTAGWNTTGGPYEDGWDYAVTVTNSTTGLESAVASAMTTGVEITPASGTWLVCNDAPWLDTPLGGVRQIDSSMLDDLEVYRPAGRRFAVVTRRAEDPPRQWSISWRRGGDRGDDVGDAVRSAATSGRQMTVLTPRGDRIDGVIGTPKTSQDPNPAADVDATLVEVLPETAGFNRPAGVMLDGSADYLTVADAADLDPGTSAFTVVVAGAFADAGYALTKGNIGTAAGYSIHRSAANTIRFFCHGASTSGGPSYASATWVDGKVHVAGGDSSGTAQNLYMDGTSVATASVTHGSISNAIALIAGANNGGASGFMAVAPFQSFALWLRVLTAAEHAAAAKYLLGVPGHRMPGGAVLFVDLRDNRCWDGISTSFTDLSGYGHTATAVSAPPTRGVPWPLRDLDRWS